MIGLVITTYERPQYVRRSLASLAASQFTSPVTVVIVDDGSQAATRRLVTDFELPEARLFKLFRPRETNFGVHECLRMGWDFLLHESDCTYLANLDSDAIVAPNWLTQLERLYVEQRARRGPLLVTGFNTPNHPVLETHADYGVKQSLGGINVFFDVDFYHALVRKCLFAYGWDWAVVRAMQAEGFPMLCTTPSVVQHIGRRGHHSNRKVFDEAPDFPQQHWWPRGWSVRRAA